MTQNQGINCTGIEGKYQYAIKICPYCEFEFCYGCCKSTNVDHGAKHEADFMLCPVCGYDYYKEN